MSWKEEIEKMNKKWNGKTVACPKYYGDQIFTNFRAGKPTVLTVG